MAYLSSGSLVASEPASTALSDRVSLYGRASFGAEDWLKLSHAFASYAAIYRSQLWVSTLVSKLAFGTARLPLKTYRRMPDGRNDARDTPYGRLLRKPNRAHDPFFFWLWTSSTYDIYGEALWVKIRPRPGAAPVELWPLHPANVTVTRDENGELRYLWQYASDAAFSWGVADIVHFKNYNPETQTRGLSRLEPLRPTLVNEDAIRRAQSAFWNNGGRPSVILSHPKTLTEPAEQRVQASWNAAHQGVDSWAKAAILEEGMTATVTQLSAEEMQYIESRRINREEACALYDVPPPVVHLLERATFSNITEQHRSMYRDTMAPRLGLFEAALDQQLRPDFDPTGELYAEFLMDEVLRGAFEQRTEAYQRAIQSGWMKPSEVRQAENLPDAGEEADRLYINGAIMPMAAQPAEEPVGDLVEDVPVQRAANARRAVLGRLGRVADLASIDLLALTAGLDERTTGLVIAHVRACQARREGVAVLRQRLNSDLTGEVDG